MSSIQWAQHHHAYTYALLFCFAFFYSLRSFLMYLIYNRFAIATLPTMTTMLCHETCESCSTLAFIILNKWEENTNFLTRPREACVTVAWFLRINSNRARCNWMTVCTTFDLTSKCHFGRELKVMNKQILFEPQKNPNNLAHKLAKFIDYQQRVSSDRQSHTHFSRNAKDEQRSRVDE